MKGSFKYELISETCIISTLRHCLIIISQLVIKKLMNESVIIKDD